MDKLTLAVLAALLSGLVSFISIPVIIRVAELKHLFDEPDHRKKHLKRTPTLGGMAIFLGLILSYMFFLDFNGLSNIKFVVPALLVIFFAGIKDDILILTPMKKLLAQFLAAFLIVYLGDVRINSFYGLFGLQEISPLFAVVFTIIAIIAIINSYNLIDGVDGLAGSLGLLSSVVYGIWFYKTGYLPMMILSFSLAGAIVGFLFFNWSPAKIFMGDTGAMIIGFVMSILSIQFIEWNKARSIPAEFWVYASPSVAIAVISIPIMDMIRVFVVRLSNRHSPFKADRNHLHHILTDLKMSHKQIVSILFIWNLLLIGIASSLKSSKSSVLLLVIIALVYIPSFFLASHRKRISKVAIDQQVQRA